MSNELVELSELMAKSSGSVNPAKYPTEEFELFSIPAFDTGIADIKRGEEIGSSKQCVEPGDVLLSKIVPHIRRAWIVSSKNEHRQIASGEWIVFRNTRIHAPFLRQLLVGDVFHAMFMNTVAGVGGSLLRARPAHVAKIQIPLPPLSEQRRIAEILDGAEALRAKRRAALALLDELTQSIFLEMFGDPVSNPKGWTICPFGELAVNRDSLRVPIKQSDRDMRSGQYPYYGSVGIIDDIDDYLFDGPHLLISEDGKHLETRNRPICCLADGRFWVNNHAHVVAWNGQAELVYLAYNLEMRPLHQFVTGIDQFKLNRKTLDSIPVVLPPLDLQRRFVAFIDSVDQQKSRFNDQIGELDQLFAALQHRAFRGELSSRKTRARDEQL